jgi:hypothetical protein
LAARENVVRFPPHSDNSADIPDRQLGAIRDQPRHFARQQNAPLFDHLVCPAEQREWHVDAKRLGDLEIDD